MARNDDRSPVVCDPSPHSDHAQTDVLLPVSPPQFCVRPEFGIKRQNEANHIYTHPKTKQKRNKNRNGLVFVLGPMAKSHANIANRNRVK